MPFVKGVSGNPQGRPKAEDLVNPKSVRGIDLRDDEFKQILRRLKPLNKKALSKLHVILDDNTSTDATKMKAIAFVIGMYKDLMNEVYGKEDGEESTVDKNELNPAPVFSLRMIGSENKSE